MGAQSGVEVLLAQVAAINHPLRLRIIAALRREPLHVSALARQLGISRALLYMHLEKLEAPGFVHGTLSLSPDGKAIKTYTLVPFDIRIDDHLVARLVDDADPGDTHP